MGTSAKLMALLFMATMVLHAATRIDTNFEGGSLERIQQISPTHFRLAAHGETDQDGRNRQASWYYFHVSNPPAGELILDLVGLPGEYNYQPNKGAITGATPPWISYDNRNWSHLDTVEYDAQEPRLRLRIAPVHRSFTSLWVAHTPPYTNVHLSQLRKEAQRHPAFQEEVIGNSVQGRPLYLWTITAPGPINGRKVAWLFFRQHSWESGSSWTGEGAVQALLSDTPQARRLREQMVWKIVPMSDPDGVARGGVRFNAHGYDLNRNWDVDDPVRMPEITAERRAVQRWLETGHSIDLLYSLHNTETSEYLEGPPDQGGHGRFTGSAERFYNLLVSSTLFTPSRPLFYSAGSTAADRPGRMTITQGLYARFGIAGFLMEQRIAFNSKFGRFPTVADRRQFGRELVTAIWTALTKQQAD